MAIVPTGEYHWAGEEKLNNEVRREPPVYNDSSRCEKEWNSCADETKQILRRRKCPSVSRDKDTKREKNQESDCAQECMIPRQNFHRL